MNKRESSPGRSKAAKIESLSRQIHELEKTVSWSTAIGFSLAAATAVAAALYSRMANAKARPGREYREPLRSARTQPTVAKEPDSEFPVQTAIVTPIQLVETFAAVHPSAEETVTESKAVIDSQPELVEVTESVPLPSPDVPLHSESEWPAEVQHLHSAFTQRVAEPPTIGERSTQELLLKIEDLRRQNLALELQLEEERELRLAFEKSLAPRILPRWSNGRGVWNFAPLTRYRGTRAIVRYLPDAEATRAASEVVDTLKASGWEIASALPDPQLWSEFLDGVIVETSMEGVALRTEEGVSYGPSSTLIDFLHENGWAARTFENASDIPAGMVQISVGFKPSPHCPTTGTAIGPDAEDGALFRGSPQDDHW